MSIPNEALQKLLQEIEQKAAFSQQQIALVKAQISAKHRESRMLQLTANELESLPAETPVYEGVGRMFVGIKTPDMKSRLAAQSGDIKTETGKLEQKLHYLETTAKNSQAHIEKMLSSGGRS